MRRALIAATTLACTAALVSGATATATAATGTAGTGAPHAVPPQSAEQHRVGSGQEHFRIIATSAASRRQSVIATGAFTAGGYQVPGRVVSLRATDKMVFPRGSFLVTRHITRQWLPLPTASCLVRETIHGTYVISHGTGPYAGISGSGGFALRIRGVIARRRGGCGGPMTAVQQVTYAGGAIRG